MHSYNGLFDKTISRENLELAFRKAAKGKRKRKDVQKVFKNLGKHITKLQYKLEKGIYYPDYHTPTIINESSSKKTREIVKPSFLYEQIVHHAVMQTFIPIITPEFYEFTCGSIPKRGTSYGKKYMRKWIDSYKGQKLYVMKADVHHFYPSIDREILKAKLARKIRDKRYLRLLFIIVEYDRIGEVFHLLKKANVQLSEVQTEILLTAMAFCDDESAIDVLDSLDLPIELHNKIGSAILSRVKGIPLGYYTSQWLGNFYFSDFDHEIKDLLQGCKFMRYVDDIVILHKNKKKLRKAMKAIADFLLPRLELEIKHDYQIFRYEYKANGGYKGRFLDFLGYTFHTDRTGLRKADLLTATRKARHIGKLGHIDWYNASQMMSYMALFTASDTYNFWTDNVKQNIKPRQLRHTISKHDRKENYYERLEISRGFASGKAA
jgi:hypothetical protein